MSQKNNTTKGYIPYNYIEPSKPEHQEQVDEYIKKLNITLPQEEFVLKCLLSLDWNRRVIVSYIEEIKYVNGMIRFRFTLTAPSRSVNYSCSDPYKEGGWSNAETFEERAWYVMTTFRKYCI
jgi:hypothetical protein